MNKQVLNLEAFFKMSYGLYVVSAMNTKGEMGGLVANAVFQVTAEPPKLAIACNKDNHTTQLILDSKKLSVSVLSEDAKPGLLGTFGFQSGRDVDKFKDVTFKMSPLGIPIVTENAVSFMEGTVVETFDVGTHYLFITEIESADLLHEDEVPMTYAYYREHKRGKAPKNAPTYIKKEVYDAIAEKNADKAVGKAKTEEKKEPKKALEVAQKTSKDLGPKYICLVCDHIYDPEEGDPDSGIPPLTPFSELPDDWECPICGVGKDEFEVME